MNASYNVNNVSANTFIIWTLSAVDSTPKPFLWKFHVKISLFPSSICLCRFYITILSYLTHITASNRVNLIEHFAPNDNILMLILHSNSTG